MNETPDPDNRWHLDKKVPITLVIMILIQLAAFLLFAGRVMQRDEEQERRLAAIEAKDTSSRVGILESRLGDMIEGIKDMSRKLDRLIERGGVKP